MREMIKRRKDEGFTLIELMIVIAVIGILAIVLVPKVGTIKTQSKSTGIDTNVRMVQGYIQSRISSWNNSSSTPTASTVATDVYNAFSTDTNPNIQDQIVNPFSSKKASIEGAASTSPANAALYVITDGTGVDVAGTNKDSTAGTVVVAPHLTSSVVDYVYIYPHDSTGAVIVDKTVKITP